MDAFLKLRRRPGFEDTRLLAAGYLGAGLSRIRREQFAAIRGPARRDHFEYLGEVDRRGKLEFLEQIDVLSVPTVYRDPKGLFVLESLAAGVPVVQPDHGAFPELLEALGGGRLTRPNDAGHLADVLRSCWLTTTASASSGVAGGSGAPASTRGSHGRATWEIFRRFVK